MIFASKFVLFPTYDIVQMYMYDKSIALYTYNDIIIICYRHTHSMDFIFSIGLLSKNNIIGDSLAVRCRAPRSISTAPVP